MKDERYYSDAKGSYGKAGGRVSSLVFIDVLHSG